MAEASPFISTPPRDLAGWVALFDPAALPVLASSADALEELRPNEDAVDAHLLAETIASDPLMTVKLLAHVAALRRGREGGETETVTEALVMLGIPPFFRAFGPQTAAEELLAGQPAALEGFQRVLRRAHRAARFAIGFAVHRMDHDAPVIHEAALLHDFAELLLWLRAPTLALAIAERQRADPALRSAAVQRELLHVTLAELQQALMTAWRLPALLVRLADDHGGAANSQVRTVQLAIRVARHSADGWDNAALPDDLREVGELLLLAPEPTARLLREIDAD
ncbi:MAG: HDOD domain-containing protein [Rubrivivax sp.]|nr:HDOD domain-containing protein [Rubrivivax sp.]